jgi:GH25 family lysozyme M1 (1,4-beta-N-acetylmuramidase)
MTVNGQDWASYQSPTPSTSGLSFAFIKVTQGLTYVNPLWQQQRAHAAAAGLVVGLYHYPDMANSPAAEADHFLSVAQPTAGEVLCLDWEGYDAANLAVPKPAQAVFKGAWLAYVRGKQPQHQTGLYCNKDYWLNVDTTSDCGDFLWIATTGLPAGEPGIEHPWMFHQWAVAGGVDQDVSAAASAAALRAWASAKVPKPPAPKPAPAPSYEPFPGAAWFTMGRVSPVVGRMHARLVAEGCDKYRSSLGKDVIGTGDVNSYEAWQAEFSRRHNLGWTGDALKWPPGKESWDGLQVPKG